MPAGAGWVIPGPDGNIWFTECDANKVGRISPSGKVTEFSLPTPDSRPRGIAKGPDGNLWFVEKKQIGRITPAGTVTEFALPPLNFPGGAIITGPDLNLWFTSGGGFRGSVGAATGRITPEGKATLFPIPHPELPRRTNLYDALNLTAGPDGNVWFTQVQGENIGRITPTGNVTLFPIPTARSRSSSITLGPDKNLWFVEDNTRHIGRITPTGTFAEIEIPTFVQLVTLGNILNSDNGDLWLEVSDNDGQTNLMRIQPSSGPPLFTEYNRDPTGLRSFFSGFDSPDTTWVQAVWNGNLWGMDRGKLRRVATKSLHLASAPQ